MKFLKNDVVLLLGFLLLFCFGLSFLRNDGPIITSNHPGIDQDIDDRVPGSLWASSDESQKGELQVDLGLCDRIANRYEKLTDLSTDQLISYMGPLFITKSASAIISFLKHIPCASVFHVVQAIVQDTKIHLPPRVKLRIIFAAAQRHKNTKDRYALFDLITQDKRLQKGAKPLLVKAVETGHAPLVPDMITWAKRANIGDIASEALVYAARHDDEDPEALRELYEAGVNVSSSMATQLLSQLVASCGEGFSVEFLVRRLRADVNHVTKNMTPLMNAVTREKISLVLELLKNGADPHYEVAGNTGRTALRMVKERGNVQLEELLRSFRV